MGRYSVKLVRKSGNRLSLRAEIVPLTIHGCVAVVHLTRGKRTIIDAEDAGRVRLWNWSAKPNRRGGFYAYSSRISLQNFVYNAPKIAIVDHRNGDTLDNRKDNLRIADFTINAVNRISFGRSGFKGVYGRCNRFEAYIRPNGKMIRLGKFKNPEDAARAYDEAARIHYGEYAAVNFPMGKERCARKVPLDLIEHDSNGMA